MLADPELLDLIDVIGDHYTIKGNAALTKLNEEYGKEVWYSEGVAPMINAKERINAQPELGGVGGTIGIIDLATRYISSYKYADTAYAAKMTRWEFQPAIAGFYQGSAYSPKQLIGAFYPWSGYYEADGGLQVVQHFTLFSEIGWSYIEGACYGDGTYSDGGVVANTGTNHYLTITDPDTDDYSMIFANNTEKERVYQVQVKNLDTYKYDLNVWETRGPDEGEEYDANWLQKIDTVSPTVTSSDGVSYFNITVKPYSMITVTTLLDKGTSYVVGQNESSATNDILALPYTDDFEYSEYAVDENGMTYLERRAGTPRFTADQRGAFDVEEESSNTANHVLTQVITQDIIGAEWNVWGGGIYTTYTPNTWLGDQRWANYKASIDVKIDTSGTDNNFAGLGIRQNEASGGSDSSAYGFRIYSDGTYKLTDSGEVKAQGVVENFDNTIWHNIAIEGKENVIVAYVDGVEIVTYTDTTSPNLCGRLSIISGYYNTYYDNLLVEPIDGYAPYSEKYNDASKEVTFSNTGWTFKQSGYAHYNRTLMEGSESGSISYDAKAGAAGEMNKIYYYHPAGGNWTLNYGNAYTNVSGAYAEVTFAGTGFDFYGGSQSSGTNVNVYVDGTLHGSADLGTGGGLVYSISGLTDGTHTVKIEQATGYASIVKFKIHDSAETTSFTSVFTGTGFNLFGATAAAVIDVYVDGVLVDNDVSIAATGNRDCSYFMRGLEDGAHTIKVLVESGTFTLDGIDAIGSVYGAPANKTITSIEVKKAPTRVEYATSEAIVDLSGIEVTVNYEDGSSDDLTDPTLFTPTAIDQDTVGEQIITITYRGFTTSFTINVVPGGVTLDPTEISVISPPNKTIYGVGEELDLNGLVIRVEFEDGSHFDIDDTRVLSVTGFDSSKIGIQELTVTYKEKTTTFTVTVTDYEASATLAGIQIVSQPDKVTYQAGEVLDLAGLEIVAYYSDGSQSSITDLSTVTFSGFDSSKDGYQIVTVTYQGKTAAFYVEVVGNGSSNNNSNNASNGSETSEEAPITTENIGTEDSGNTDQLIIPATMKTQVNNGTLLVVIDVNKKIVENLVNNNQQTDKNDHTVKIPATDNLINKISSDEVTSIYSNININKDFLSSGSKININSIDVSKEILSALQQTGKKMQINIVDETNTIWYAWVFDGTQLKNSNDSLSDVNLALKLSDSEMNNSIDGLINKDKNNTLGYILSVDDTSKVPSGTVLKVNVKARLGYQTGKKLYLYHYNEESGKLESMSKVKYTVDKDGFINLNTKYVDKLVIVENEANTLVKTSLLKQITCSTKKTTLKKGKTLIVAPTLPEVIAVVPNFSASNTYKYGDEIMLAMVTYKSSNSSVATVDKVGKVTAKKAGKVTITITVNLENGKKTTFEKTVTVK